MHVLPCVEFHMKNAKIKGVEFCKIVKTYCCENLNNGETSYNPMFRDSKCSYVMIE